MKHHDHGPDRVVSPALRQRDTASRAAPVPWPRRRQARRLRPGRLRSGSQSKASGSRASRDVGGGGAGRNQPGRRLGRGHRDRPHLERRDVSRASDASEMSRSSPASRRACFARSAWCLSVCKVASSPPSIPLRKISTAVSAWTRARFACSRAFLTRNRSSSMRAWALEKHAIADIAYRPSSFSSSAAHASASAASTIAA